MKVFVIADNHGDREILEKLIPNWKKKADILIHLGDSELSSDDEIWDGVYTVGGNMDAATEAYDDELVIQAGSNKIFVAHGHQYDVHDGRRKLVEATKAQGANIALYGHTHIASIEKIDGILAINPGSITKPKGSTPIAEFAVLDIEDKDVIITYYNRNEEEIYKKNYDLN